MSRFKSSPNRSTQKSGSSLPSHLYLKGNFYYFRVRFSDKLRKRLGYTEFRLNLGTGYIRLAKNLAGHLYFHMFKLLREKTAMDYREIKRRMNILLRSMLDREQNDVSPPPNYDRLSKAAGFEFNPEVTADGYALISKNIAMGGANVLAKHGTSVIAGLVQAGVFTREEISEDNIMQITKAYFQMETNYQALLAKRARGDFISEDQVLFSDYGVLPGEERISSTIKPTASPVSPSPLYSEACNSYIENRKLDNRWKKTTWADHENRLRCFPLIMGDLPIAKITHDTMAEFKLVLRRLPPRWNRDRKYTGKTPREIADLNISPALNVKTVNETLRTIESFFEWCVNVGKLDRHFAKGLQIKDPRSAGEQKDAFSIEELILIFSHPKFANGEFKSPAYFWIPVIGLYTGMRLEEISQLHCADLYQVGGIWVIDIHEIEDSKGNNGKTLKTKSATRKIPIHPNLIEIGLLKYHSQMAEQGHTRLFPALNQTEKVLKFGKQPGKQFKSVVDSVLKNAKKQSFHSLRHTFDDFYKQRGATGLSFEEVFGHQHKKLADDRYGGRILPSTLFEEVISKLDYGPELLNILKRSQFAITD